MKECWGRIRVIVWFWNFMIKYILIMLGTGRTFIYVLNFYPIFHSPKAAPKQLTKL